MMTDDDAGLFPIENFASFDSIEDEIHHHNSPVPKGKKKNDFNFTSLWRKPKLGLRKMKGIGKGQGANDRRSDNPSSHKTTIGRYFKDRDSFETTGSIPLSDYDEAKDTFSFLDFRSKFSNHEEEGNGVKSNTSRILKDRMALNPKMFLTPTPTKLEEAKRNIKTDHVVTGKSNKDESFDMFSNFDGFQTFSKESLNKPKLKDEGGIKEKEGESGDLNKENFSKDSNYSDNLYYDHGPILSSLSEDTICSDSIRGERFLEDNFNENRIESNPSSSWNAFNTDESERRIQAVCNSSNRNEECHDKVIPEVDPSVKIETKVRSFSDRLKLFQSKPTQPAEQATFGSTKQHSMISTRNIPESIKNPYECELAENIEDASFASISGIQTSASNLKKGESLIGTGSSEIESPIISGDNEVNNSQKSDEQTSPSKLCMDIVSCRAERRNSLQILPKKGESALSSEKRNSERNNFGVILSKSDHNKVEDASGSEKNETRETNGDKGLDQPSAVLITDESEDKLYLFASEDTSRSDCPQNVSDVSSITMYSNSTIPYQYASKFGVTVSKRRDSKSKQELGRSEGSEHVASPIESATVDKMKGPTLNVTIHNDPMAPELQESTNNIEQNANLREHEASLEICTRDQYVHMTTKNKNDEKLLKSDDEIDTIPDTLHSATVNTTVSSLNSSPATATFTQQSASIFGVTLSKTRNRSKKKAFRNKDVSSQRDVKAPLTAECSETPCVQNNTGNLQTMKVEFNDDCQDPQEHEKEEMKKNSVIGGECEQSRKCMSLNCVSGKTKNEFLQPEQEAETTQPEPRLTQTSTNEMIQSENTEYTEDRTRSIPLNPEVELVCSPEKKKSSLADRRKLFEREGISSRTSCNREYYNIESTACDKSPKSKEKSRSPSLGDRTVLTKRRSIRGMGETENDDLQISLRESTTASLNAYDPNNNDDHMDGVGLGEDIGSNSRRTLQSAQKGGEGASERFKPNSEEVVSNHLDKSEISVHDHMDDHSEETEVDDDEDVLKNRRKTLKTVKKEKKVEGEILQSSPIKALSPTRAAYSFRQKFFENLDRSRAQKQSSMSRPFVENKQTIITDSSRLKKQEIGSLQDVQDGENLPMFVTVEEDFLLKDNISTCLSASENRSVVCRPDALLYSVSQKAMALMTSKREKAPMISSSTARKNFDKETVLDDSNQKRMASPNLILNRQESLKKTSTEVSSESCDRSKVSSECCDESNAQKEVDVSKDENNSKIKFSIENRESNKKRTSTLSQQYNRFAKKKVLSEFCNESKAQKETANSEGTQDESGSQSKPLIENQEPNRMSTSAHPQQYNRFARKKVSSKFCNESKAQKETVDSEGTEDESGSPSKPLVENQEPNIMSTSAHPQQYNRFARKKVLSEFCDESKAQKQTVSDEGTPEKNDSSTKPLIERKESNEMNKAAPSHRYKYNRFTRKGGASNIPIEPQIEPPSSKLDSEVNINNDAKGDDKKPPSSIEYKETNGISKAPPSHRFKYNRFTRKGVASNIPVEPQIEPPSKSASGVDANSDAKGDYKKLPSSIENKESNEMSEAPPSHRFKYNLFTRKDVASNTQGDPEIEPSFKSTSEVDANINAKGDGKKPLSPIGSKESNEMSKVTPSHRFKYNRFTKVGSGFNTPPESKTEPSLKVTSEADANIDAEEGDDKKPPASNESKESNGVSSKAALSRRFKFNRFTRTNDTFSKPIESERELPSKLDREANNTNGVKDSYENKDRSSIEKQEPNNINESVPSDEVKYNCFARKKAPSDVCQELDRQELPSSKDINVDGIQDDTARSSNESQNPEKNNEILVETEKKHANVNDNAEVPGVKSQRKRMVSSMSIRERRMFFESQSSIRIPSQEQ